jgi:hypothetical protein
MTPWELRDHLGFLLSEVAPGDPKMGAVAQTLNRLRVNWHALWARSGDAAVARPEYAALLNTTWAKIEAQGVHEIALRNQLPLGRCLKALIFTSALGDLAAAMDGDERIAPGAKPPPPKPAVQTAPAPTIAGRDPVFDRPIFIVSSPRSGSTLLFETLSAAPDLYTIGGESHGLMESIPQINPASRGWDSNRLTAADATADMATPLRERFLAALRDRTGARSDTKPSSPHRRRRFRVFAPPWT